MEIKKWGEINNESVFLYSLINKNEMKVALTNIGAGIQSILVKDKSGRFADVVLGYDTAAGYEADPFYIGTVVGRFANRIAADKINLNGKTYQLTLKDNSFHHHGGKIGFNKKLWQGIPFYNDKEQGVTFNLLSLDGDEGFPGNLQVSVKYTLTDDDRLIVNFTAETDKTTVINLTQHTYFNLAGHDTGNILDHQLMIDTKKYLPVNNMIVPTGTIADVTGTPFDFSTPKAIKTDIEKNDTQLQLGNGYDHTWVLKNERSDELKLAAKSFDPQSGRTLTVYTSEPGIHLYTSNWLDGSAVGKRNVHYQKHAALCLETQNYPDAPNNPHFPSTVLNPGEIFKSATIFEFGLT